MATMTFYMADNSGSGPTGAGNSVQGLSETPAAAVTDISGWVVSTGSTLHSAYGFGSKRPASTFADTVPPSGTIGGSSDGFATDLTYNGDFASANWVAHFVVRAVTLGGAQDGRIRFRLFKCAANGASATEITSGHQQCSIVTDVSTSADFDSTLTFNPGAFTVTNQYLYFQVAWERTGAGGMTTSDILFRTGSSSTVGTRIVTSNFTVAAGGATPSDTSLYRRTIQGAHFQ